MSYPDFTMKKRYTVDAERKSLSKNKNGQIANPVYFTIPWRLDEEIYGESDDRKRTTGKWFKLSSDRGYIYRVLRYSSDSYDKDTQKCKVAIDYDGWIQLSGYTDKDQIDNLIIEECCWWDYVLCSLTHPDPTHRLAGILAITSLTLGLISIVLALALT